MQSINVKKFGNSATILVDSSNDQPISISSWDAEFPDGYFPFTAQVHDIIARYGAQYNLHFLERPEPNLPIARRVKATPEDLQGLPPPAAPGAPAVLVASTDDVSKRALREIELFLVKLEVAEGKKAKALREEYFFVRKLVLKLFPTLAEQVNYLEQEHSGDE